MSDLPAADRAMGLELEIEELVEQQKRASVQGRTDDAAGMQPQIEVLQSALADAAEQAAEEGPPHAEVPYLHNAEELSISDPRE